MGKLGTYSDAPMITDPQLRFLTNLTEELFSLTLTITGEEYPNRGEAIEMLSTLTKRVASHRISELKESILPTMRQTARYRAQTVEAPVSARTLDTDALYVVGTDIVRLKVSRAGRTYGMILDTESRRFEYAPGIVSKVTPDHKMTAEQAKKFGDAFTYCCRCGADLTDPVSVAQGMGPVCITYQR